jgi:DNA-binding NtrC family response regulator
MANHRSITILLVDDEEEILSSSETVLTFAGVGRVKTVNDSRKVLSLLGTDEIDIVVLDLMMPYLSGRELLSVINHEFPQVQVIVMTAADDVMTAVDCMKEGAFDYLVKPVENSRLLSSVKNAIELFRLKNQVTLLREHLLSNRVKNPAAFATIITVSQKMSSIFQYCEVIAVSTQPVTVTGETGVGKELMARAIHEVSGVSGKFVPVNVAGLDDNMFADALFGHKKGAFTGADQARNGLIAQAGGGTLFLDEIGDLTHLSQVKLLRLLQDQEYYPVGSDIPQISDARIILATNHDLREMSESGKFRKDLYYRLCTHQVLIPPLRDRLEDIPFLFEHFLQEASDALKKEKPAYRDKVISLLSTYLFPGNVREFKAIVFDAVARNSSGNLSTDYFKKVIGASVVPSSSDSLLAQSFVEFMQSSMTRLPKVYEVEDYLIKEALRQAKGNQGIAASILGFSRQTLNKRLQKAKNSGDTLLVRPGKVVKSSR